MPDSWRLVDSDLVQPGESAALDEAILEAHIAGMVPNTLHFYRRIVPTVSVGYFQKVSESVDIEECRKRGVAVVRRKSGGSTIYTDSGQLIYGLVVHESELPGELQDSFKKVCTAIASAISSFGTEAEYRPLNDIEVQGKKVSGNAQLRRKGSVLQHGTILAEADIATMDAILKVKPTTTRSADRASERVATLTSILGAPPEMEVLKGMISIALGEAFGARFKKSGLVQFEKETVVKLVDEFYSKDDWNFKY